jgi:hypothetical protein
MMARTCRLHVTHFPSNTMCYSLEKS